MRKSLLKVGSFVYFGTAKGPRTRAKVVRLNPKTVLVTSTAKRGENPAGSQWLVGYGDLFATKGKTKPKPRAKKPKR